MEERPLEEAGSEEGCPQEGCMGKDMKKEADLEKGLQKEAVSEKDIKKEAVSEKDMKREADLEKGLQKEIGMEKDMKKEAVSEKDMKKEADLEKGLQKEAVSEKDMKKEVGLKNGLQKEIGMEKDMQKEAGMEKCLQKEAGLEKDMKKEGGLEKCLQKEAGMEKNLLGKRMDGNRISLALINIGCVVSLFIIIFPLLLIAKYDYPSADDWSYGMYAYKALKAGGGFMQVLQAALQGAKEAYLGWDGRFANAFLDSLQPGIWGEKYYALTPWILIGILVASEMFFFRFLICFGTGKRDNALLWVPIVVPMLMIQILYTPSPVESFYWYTGGMNYTFMYGLSLVLMVLFLRLGLWGAEPQVVPKPQAAPGPQGTKEKLRRVLLTAGACVLSVFVGGGNFSTSVSTILAVSMLTGLFLMRKNYLFLRRTWFVPLMTTVCLVICLFSPGSVKGNHARMTEMGNPLTAIWRSLAVSAHNIGIWTLTGSVLLMVLFILPFAWRVTGNLGFSFRYPLFFSALTFGVYASQAAPNLYVSGNLGGGRNLGVLYYSYLLWLVGNIVYWAGWVRRRRDAGRRGRTAARRLHGGVLLTAFCGLAGIALVSHIYVFDKKGVSSYKAYRDWRQGWAQQYAREWEERLEILHDDDIREVVFEPISVYPEMLLYADLQEEDGYIWVNSACAAYYGKDAVHVIAQEQ